jgi:hypothetical protein
MDHPYLYRDVLDDYIMNLIMLGFIIYLLTFKNFIYIKKI